MDFGDLISAGRREMGFSQEELAEIMDKSEADIALWEAGLEVPSEPSTVMELAAALRLEPDVLLAAAEDADVPDAEELETDAEAAPDDEAPPEPEAEPGDPVTQSDPADTFGSAVVTRAAPRRAPSPTQVAAARVQMPAPAPSYLEDDKLVRLYRIRLIATTVVGLILLWVFFWAFGNFWDAVGVLWDSLRPGA